MGKTDKNRLAQLLVRNNASASHSGGFAPTGVPVAPRGGFAFGASYLVQVSGAEGSAEDITMTSKIDSDMAQQLQRVSKRDSTTRLKALQSLLQIVQRKDAEDATSLIGAWSYVYAKLIMDVNRAVRAAAARVMGQLATTAGRALAPHLKSLVPYWYLQQYDEASEVAATAQSSFESAFAGSKAHDAILFCRHEVIKLLENNLHATPQSLGDPKRETSEELLERYERVLAATCVALAALAERVIPLHPENPKCLELMQGINDIMAAPGFTKITLLSKQPRIRHAALSMVASMCRTTQIAMTDSVITQIASPVFGSFGEKEPVVVPAVWGAALSLATSHPEAWQAVDLRKVVLPRLWAMLRHAGYGAADVTFPAVLPLLALLPSSVLVAPVFQTLLTSVWAGLEHCVADSAAQQAALECYIECFVYSLTKEGMSPHDMVDAVLPCTAVRASLLSEPETLCVAGRTALCGIIDGLRGKQYRNMTTFVDGLVLALKAPIHAKLEERNAAALLAAGHLVASLFNAFDDDVAQLETFARQLLTEIQPSMVGFSEGDATTALLETTSLMAMLMRALPAAAISADEICSLAAQIDVAIRMATEQSHQGEAFLASCALIASSLPLIPDGAEKLAIALGSLIDAWGYVAGVALAREVCVHVAGNVQLASPEMDALCIGAVARVAYDSAAVDLVDIVLTGRNSKTSFVTPDGEARILALLSESVKRGISQAAAAALDDATLLEAGRSLRIVRRIVHSKVYVDREASRVRALLSLVVEVLRLLVCAHASCKARNLETNGIQEGAEEDRDGGDELMRAAMAIIVPPEDVAGLLTSATPELQRWFLAEVVTIVGSSEASPDVATYRVALLNTYTALKKVQLHEDFVRQCRGSAPHQLRILASAIGIDGVLAAFSNEEAPERIVDMMEDADVDAESIMSTMQNFFLHGNVGLLAILRAAQQRSDFTALVAVLRAVCANIDEETTRQIIIDYISECISAMDEQAHVCRAKTLQTLTVILQQTVRMLRTKQFYLESSGLPRFAVQLCDESVENQAYIDDERMQLVVCNAIAACYPCDVTPAPQNPQPPTTFSKGDSVWYKHASREWERAAVEAVDRSITPPSYAVRLSSGIRETEAHRLHAWVEGEVPPRHQSNILATLPYIMLETERMSLLRLARTFLKHADAERQSSTGQAMIVRCAVALCHHELSAADWLQVLQWMINFSNTYESAVQEAAKRLAAAVMQQSAALSGGAALGNPVAAMAFFRKVCRKGVLKKSERGKSAVEEVQRVLENAMKELDAVSDDFLPCLDTYCLVAAVASNAGRTLPVLDWESSQAAICTSVLHAYTSWGAIESIAGACGLRASLADVAAWNRLSEMAAAMVAVADDAFLQCVVERADASAQNHGVDCVEALVALALLSQDKAAYGALLAFPVLLDRLCDRNIDREADDLRPTSSSARWESLEAAGVCPELASATADPSHPAFVAAWVLLVGYLLQGNNRDASSTLVQTLRDEYGIVGRLLDMLVDALPLKGLASARGKIPPSAKVLSESDTSDQGFVACMSKHGLVRSCDVDVPALGAIAPLLYAGVLRALPVPCRVWFATDLRDRTTAAALERYTSFVVTPGLVEAEFEAVKAAGAELSASSDGRFTVRAVPSSREVVASLEVEDGHALELVVRLPFSLPLRPPEAECRKSVGVQDARLRKWLLSITAILRTRNGAVADSIRLWKRNVDSEFEGHEDCLICYSIINPATGQLPRLACRTCRKKFHGACLYKWFGSSGKSTCPHCQSPW